MIQKLCKLAYATYGEEYPEDRFDLHFHYDTSHITTRTCQHRINPIEYEKKLYYPPESLHDGELRLIAHFVANSIRLAELAAFFQLRDDESIVSQTGGRTEEGPLFYRNSLATERYGFAEGSGSIGRRNNPTTIVGTDLAAPKSFNYPPLPAEATSQRWQGDFLNVYNSLGAYTNIIRRRAIAHTTLIESNFWGVVAQTPCWRCVTGGIPCRIYHPQMDKW